MSELQIFKNEKFGTIRAIEINGEAWCVGKGVALALGYSNPQKAVRDHVDEIDKGVNEMVTPGGRQQIPIINESGVYSLIFSSKLPKVKVSTSVNPDGSIRTNKTTKVTGKGQLYFINKFLSNKEETK